jgi:phage baseplate assembly protein W
MNAKIFGYNPAFYGGPNNILSRQEDEQIIKNDLLQLILTVPGERVFRPDFGTPLRSSIFEPLDRITTENLRTKVIDAIQQHERRVTLVTLDIVSNEEQNALRILLVARLRSDPTKFISINHLVNGPQ